MLGSVEDAARTKRQGSTGSRRLFAGTRLVREVSYLHPDEAEALVGRATRERCSKAEIIRRALREYLGIRE
jgi:hypothetical protein